MRRMDRRPREQYLKSLLERYFRAGKKGKTAILDKYCRQRRHQRKDLRRYVKPRTPYRILMVSGKLRSELVKALDKLYRSLNPADLKRQIDYKLK